MSNHVLNYAVGQTSIEIKFNNILWKLMRSMMNNLNYQLVDPKVELQVFQIKEIETHAHPKVWYIIGKKRKLWNSMETIKYLSFWFPIFRSESWEVQLLLVIYGVLSANEERDDEIL